MSGLIAEEIQNDVDDIGDEAPVNGDAQLEAEGQAAIAAQPTMHEGQTTLKPAKKEEKKLTKKELEAKEEQIKDDAGENDL